MKSAIRPRLTNNRPKLIPSTLSPLAHFLCPAASHTFHQTRGLKDSPPNTDTRSPVRTPPEALLEDRDFYLSILDSTSTKREARAYLQRFKPPTPASSTLPLSQHHKLFSGHPSATPTTNPAVLAASVAAEDTPGAPQIQSALQTALESSQSTTLSTDSHPPDLHVALVKIRGISQIPDATLFGLARTLGRLKRLGLTPIIVLEADVHKDEAGIPLFSQERGQIAHQAERLTTAIEAGHRKNMARVVDGALSIISNGLSLSLPDLLLKPLSRGLIPIILPLATDEATQKQVPADSYEIIESLTRQFSSSSLTSASASSPASPGATSKEAPQHTIHLDRFIFLDPLGGIPAPDRPLGAHVFVNMQQEFESIHHELSSSPHVHHLRSLVTLKNCLSICPPTTSAVITTPSAASSARVPTRTSKWSKNPLIHNLLTDKPIFSSSLPTSTSPATLTTLLKHGMPLRLWGSGTRLSDSTIDLPRLTALIEDSFNRPLDLKHYLARVDDHIAGVIVAGNYEGAAIVTWEYPDGDKSRKVCYLDKFAVAKKSQGAGGVADVVFKAMVAGVGPPGSGALFEGAEGIVWRSRRENPVNKWYFERAMGTYKFHGAGDRWTMFWTTQDPRKAVERLGDYEKICSDIEPSLR